MVICIGIAAFFYAQSLHFRGPNAFRQLASYLLLIRLVYASASFVMAEESFQYLVLLQGFLSLLSVIELCQCWKPL